MFAELRRLESGWSGRLSISLGNEALLRVYRRMGMNEVAQFKLPGDEFAVFSQPRMVDKSPTRGR